MGLFFSNSLTDYYSKLTSGLVFFVISIIALYIIKITDINIFNYSKNDPKILLTFIPIIMITIISIFLGNIIENIIKNKKIIIFGFLIMQLIFIFFIFNFTINFVSIQRIRLNIILFSIMLFVCFIQYLWIRSIIKGLKEK